MAKARSDEKSLLLTSLIRKKKFDYAFQVLRVVYTDVPWVWPTEKQDDVTNVLPNVPKTPPSLFDTCLSFFCKCREVLQQHNFPPQLFLKTESGCLFCAKEPACPPRKKIASTSTGGASLIDQTKQNLDFVSPDVTEEAQASTSSAVATAETVPTYLDLLQQKKEELVHLGTELAYIQAYTKFSLCIKKEMMKSSPLLAVCSLTGFLHLQLILVLLKCGVNPNYSQQEVSATYLHPRRRRMQPVTDSPLEQLLMRYEAFRYVANKVNFRHSTKKLKSSGVFQNFYLSRTKFHSKIWIDEHFKKKLVHNVYDLDGNAMKCTKEDYIRITSETFQVLSYMVKLSNVVTVSPGNNTISDVVFGCFDLEVATLLADYGKLSFDFDSQIRSFLSVYKLLTRDATLKVKELLSKAKFNHSACCRAIPGVLDEGFVELTKVLINFTKCYTFESSGCRIKYFRETFCGTLPIFVIPLLRGSYWESDIFNWVQQSDVERKTICIELKYAVNSVEYVLDDAVRPLLEDCIEDTSTASSLILAVAEVSQYGFLKEDLEDMDKDLPYFVFGNRASLQGLCIRKVFRDLVNKKILRFRKRSKPNSSTEWPVIFPIGLDSPAYEETPLSHCDECSAVGILCPTCLKSEWSETEQMLRAACDAAQISRKFAPLLGLECLRYEVISRISSCVGLCFVEGIRTPFPDLPLVAPNYVGFSFDKYRRRRSLVNYFSYSDDTSTIFSSTNSNSSLSELESALRSARRAHSSKSKNVDEREEESDETSSFINSSFSSFSSSGSLSSSAESSSDDERNDSGRETNAPQTSVRSAAPPRGFLTIDPPAVTLVPRIPSHFNYDAGSSNSSSGNSFNCWTDVTGRAFEYVNLANSDED